MYVVSFLTQLPLNGAAGEQAGISVPMRNGGRMEGHLYRVALAFCATLFAFFLSFQGVGQARALEAYLFRGAGDFSFLGKGLTFSNGMDRLGEKLTAMGVPAKVYRWEAMEWAYSDIMKRRPDAVMIMGHSMGALSTVALASRLKDSGIRVAYIGTIDIPGPTAIAPSNVEVAENYYHAFPVYGQLAAPPGFQGTVKNQYVWGQIHITMDKAEVVHKAALQFAGRATNVGDTMQAYSVETPTQSDAVAKVDKVLTASTTSAYVPASADAATAGVDGSQGPAPGKFVFAALPEKVPLPTPAPRG
jgi:thioesterase domain-containing protein